MRFLKRILPFKISAFKQKNEMPKRSTFLFLQMVKQNRSQKPYNGQCITNHKNDVGIFQMHIAFP